MENVFDYVTVLNDKADEVLEQVEAVANELVGKVFKYLNYKAEVSHVNGRKQFAMIRYTDLLGRINVTRLEFYELKEYMKEEYKDE